MRSIPAAMTWELLKRSRWGILAGTLGVLTFIIVLFSALKATGDFRGTESALIMNIILMLMSALVFGSAIYPALSRMPRLFPFPARTGALVAWRFIPAMLVIAVQTAMVIFVVNRQFPDMDWPFAGPVLFLPVAFAVTVAFAWLAEKSPWWLFLFMGTVGAVLGLYFRSRYGPLFSRPTHYWSTVTLAEGLTMLVMLTVAWFVSVVAISRNRSGVPPLSIGFADWLARIFDYAPGERRYFSSAIRAQTYVEWRRRGYVMPMAVALLMVVGLIAWSVVSRKADDLFAAVTTGGQALWLIGVIGGLLAGNLGPTDSSHAMGHFISTRPISDSDLARTILRTAALSTLLSWSIWLAAFLIVFSAFWVAGWSYPEFSDAARWHYFVGTLLAQWIVVGLILSLTLIGRPKVFAIVFVGVPAAIITIVVIGG